MKYKTLKALPWIDVGTVFEYNKDIITGQYGVTLVNWDTIGWLLDFLNWFGIDNDFFEPLSEKVKIVPEEDDDLYLITSSGFVRECFYSGMKKSFDQWNWRWTREEAEKEVAKRAAIERVRQYIVSNGLLEEDKWNMYCVIQTYNDMIEPNNIIPASSVYTPYGRLKYTNLTQFIEDCREDLLTIHS